MHSRYRMAIALAAVALAMPAFAAPNRELPIKDDIKPNPKGDGGSEI